MKTCFKCGRTLPLEAFYRHPMMADGHLGKCMDCTRADVIANRDAKLQAYRAYDRSRPRRDSAASRAWRKKVGHAHSVAYQVHSKPQPCSNCGAEKAHRHHPDYSQPKLIVWLCTGCHGREHARLRRLA